MHTSEPSDFSRTHKPNSVNFDSLQIIFTVKKFGELRDVQYVSSILFSVQILRKQTALEGLMYFTIFIIPCRKMLLSLFGLFEEEGAMVFRNDGNYLPVHTAYHSLFLLWHYIPTQSKATLLLRFLDPIHTNYDSSERKD